MVNSTRNPQTPQADAAKKKAEAARQAALRRAAAARQQPARPTVMKAAAVRNGPSTLEKLEKQKQHPAENQNPNVKRDRVQSQADAVRRASQQRPSSLQHNKKAVPLQNKAQQIPIQNNTRSPFG